LFGLLKWNNTAQFSERMFYFAAAINVLLFELNVNVT